MKFTRETLILFIPLLIGLTVFVPLLTLFFLFCLAIILEPVLRKPPAAAARVLSVFPVNVPVIRGPPLKPAS